jgi:hypothetical protein
VKSAILGYRYWHDERGCDVMDFWDPGHAAAFHTAQHLAGQLFPEALLLPLHVPEIGNGGLARCG